MKDKRLDATKSTRSCGTCRDRRILCDRALPACAQCAHSKRPCKGYGLRLSWPRPNDARRAVVSRSLGHGRRTRFSDARLVNVSWWDLQMHQYLSGTVSPQSAEAAPLVLCAPMPFNPFQLDVAHKSLLQYFQCTASQSLTTFGADPATVGNLLVRMALPSDSPASTAVLQSLLAFASLHRHGLQCQAAELKIAALKALSSAPKTHLGATETVQHIAAGMLLCSVEIHQASCTSGQWSMYISGIKNVIQACSSSKLDQNPEFRTLMDWVYYHDVLSRFSRLHWHPETPSSPSSPSDGCIQTLPATPSAFTTTLQLLLEVCETVAAKPPHTIPADDLDHYKGFLKILGWKIRSIPLSGKDSPCSTPVMELFQLAALIYLNRASGNLLEPATETQHRIERAFTIFDQLGSCERQFPLFVLGCEARSDRERCIVLDLIGRTEKAAASRSLYLVKRLVQAIWAQDDLANGELDYTDKISAIVSCCAILPTFV